MQHNLINKNNFTKHHNSRKDSDTLPVGATVVLFTITSLPEERVHGQRFKMLPRKIPLIPVLVVLYLSAATLGKDTIYWTFSGNETQTIYRRLEG